MEIQTILRLLKNSGFYILGTDESFIYLEDPSCILRSFETFIEYAWLAITCITGLLLFGWAISLIRGIKIEIFSNLRNLIIMFGVLSAIIPIVNMIWGDDLFAKGCRTIKVSINEVNELINTRNLELSKKNGDDLYEEINIYDSGVKEYENTMDVLPHEQTYSESPLMVPDVPEEVEVSIGTNFLGSRTTSNKLKSAKESGKDVIYFNVDGTAHKRTGGSRAWRNMNPGNIIYSEFAKNMGAIGEAGGFAVFPDEETGMKAIYELLRSKNYNKLTIAGAISRYAPPSENDTNAYHRQIQKLTGLSINKRMSDLNDIELSRVANAIKQIEGWKTGTIIQN